MINNGNGSFGLLPLPARAQFFPVYAIIAGDFNRDGIYDILLGGNQSRAKPQTGIYYSGYGLLLAGTADGNFIPLSSAESGIFATGEIRDFKHIHINSIPSIVVARNNDNF